MQHPASTKPVPEWLQREVAAIDPLLTFRFNPKIDRWQIMRLRVGEEVPSALTKADIFERDWYKYRVIMRWQDADGSYRDLDMRLVHTLRRCDLQKRGFREVLQEMEAEEAATERDRVRKKEDTIDGMGTDLYHCLNGREMVSVPAQIGE